MTFAFPRTLTLEALGCISTACMRGYSPGSYDYRLLAIPTPYHQTEMEVFFRGERPQDTAYVKVALVEHKADGEIPVRN